MYFRSEFLEIWKTIFLETLWPTECEKQCLHIFQVPYGHHLGFLKWWLFFWHLRPSPRCASLLLIEWPAAKVIISLGESWRFDKQFPLHWHLNHLHDGLRCWWDISGGWLELSVIAVPVVAILQEVQQFLLRNCSLAPYSSLNTSPQDVLFEGSEGRW